MKNAHGSVPRSEERVLRRIERSKNPTNEGSERERGKTGSCGLAKR